VAQEIVGGSDSQLFSPEDMEAIRTRRDDIAQRIATREEEINRLLEPPEQQSVEVVEQPPAEEDLPGADRLEEIRRSVADAAAEGSDQ
ncbi:MAG TPA: SPFH domain-containing protein, partial [Segeticoccus sp.]|nr:SPFH domain-containing protein [Segeticoccus sp.]